MVSAIVVGHAIAGTATIRFSGAQLTAFLPLALFHLVDFGIAALAEELQDRGYVLRVIGERRPMFAVVFTSD